MKSEFRTNKSLSADISRIETSIKKNESELLSYMQKIKGDSNKISNHDEKYNGIEIKDLLYDHSSSMRDNIDNLENDMISIEGIDIFEFKTSPDKIIDSLRSLKERTRQVDQRVENQIKLTIKAKGNGEFAEEIDNATYKVQKEIGTADELTKNVSSELKNVLKEIYQIKEHSRDLLKKKIL